MKGLTVLFLTAPLFLTVLSSPSSYEKFPFANYYSPSAFGNFYPAALNFNPYADYYIRSVINHPSMLPPPTPQTFHFYYPPYYGQPNDQQTITNSDEEDLKHLQAFKTNYDLQNSQILNPSMDPTVSPYYRSSISSSFSSFLSSYFNLNLQTFPSTKLLVLPSFG